MKQTVEERDRIQRSMYQVTPGRVVHNLSCANLYRAKSREPWCESDGQIGDRKCRRCHPAVRVEIKR